MRIPVYYLVIAVLITLTLFIYTGKVKKIHQKAQAQAILQEQNDLSIYKKNIHKVTDAKLATKRGWLYLKNKQTEKAIIILRKSTELDKNYRDSFLYLGYAYLQRTDENKNKWAPEKQQKELSLAKQALLSSQKLDPLNPLTNKLLGLIANEQGHDNESRMWYASYRAVGGR